MSRPPAGGSNGAPSAVGLSIDRLSVEGVGPSSARRLGTALERRLGGLIEERGWPAALGTGAAVDLEHLQLPNIQLDLRIGPERAGIRLAEALWARLQKPLDQDREPDREQSR